MKIPSRLFLCVLPLLMAGVMGCSQTGYQAQVVDSHGRQLVTYDSVPRKASKLLFEQRQFLLDRSYDKCRGVASVVEAIWPDTPESHEANRLAAWATLFLYDAQSDLTALRLEKRKAQILKEAITLFHKSGVGHNYIESEVMDGVLRAGFFEREAFEQFVTTMRLSTGDLGSIDNPRRQTLVERFEQEYASWAAQYRITELVSIPWKWEQEK